MVRYTAKYKNCYKDDSNQPCRTGTEKGMDCCDGRGQRSIDDVAECGGPTEKTGNELIFVFSVDKYLNKSEFRIAELFLFI